MSWKSDSYLFRDLTDDEERAFTEFARDNDPEDPSMWEIYHPVCRKAWLERGIKPPFLGEGV